jgi:tRNA U34 2-thiouridine synthase MnmA/TrmU
MTTSEKINKKAMALLSGGLDSTLAIKLILAQGVEITAVNFTSPFCNCSSRKGGCPHQARKVAAELGIPIKVIPKGMDYWKMVENPPHGYGRGMNPCIDCRIYMLKKVKELMVPWQASFIITGEVLGQRPMSQHWPALQLIERESGLEGLILRPLSAKHLPPTIPERVGIVDREKLFAHCGRSRKFQINLAREFNLPDYPCPAGGCLLTDRVIARRLKDLFLHVPDYTMADLHFLKIGRHFRLNPRLKIVVGRNQEENERLRNLRKADAPLYYPKNFRGPLAIALGDLDHNHQMIGEIIVSFSQDEKNPYLIGEKIGEEERIFPVTRKFPREKLNSLNIGG